MIERRASVELRAKGRRLEGYAAVFNTAAQIGDFTEVLLPGAFAETVGQGRDILALVDHSPEKLLARTKSGTLSLAEDSRGLAFDLSVPATSLGNDILTMVERGDVGGASFAFTIAKGGESWQGRTRTLSRLNLHEISIVSAWPAYPSTIVQARGRTPRLTLARLFLETIR